jgi:hypothetical protein
MDYEFIEKEDIQNLESVEDDKPEKGKSAGIANSIAWFILSMAAISCAIILGSRKGRELFLSKVQNLTSRLRRREVKPDEEL